MLDWKPLQESQLSPQRHLELLLECKAVLESDGMADMDEYGDMLKWGLPKKEGWTRNIHAFHPGMSDFSDQFYGTIHFHGGEIRGNILLGGMEHSIYRAEPHDEGDRFLEEKRFKLHEAMVIQNAGTTYSLSARVPHWIKPTGLTLTYFEEEDTEEMGDLINPATEETGEFRWEQEDADAALPELLGLINAEIAKLINDG
jgi:hypothetical protein